MSQRKRNDISASQPSLLKYFKSSNGEAVSRPISAETSNDVQTTSPQSESTLSDATVAEVHCEPPPSTMSSSLARKGITMNSYSKVHSESRRRQSGVNFDEIVVDKSVNKSHTQNESSDISELEDFEDTLEGSSLSVDESVDTVSRTNANLGSCQRPVVLDDEINVVDSQRIESRSEQISQASNNDGSQGDKSRGKERRTYEQKYTPVWLEKNESFRSWLCADPDDKTQAYCKPCGKPLKGANLSDLKKHEICGAHVKAVNSLAGTSQKTQKEFVASIGNVKSLNDQVVSLELALSALMVEGQSAYRFMDRLVPTLKAHVPDSQIIKKLACGRTKTMALVKTIGHAGQQALSEELMTVLFSIIVDESTDRTGTKFLIILVKYYSSSKGKVVEEFFAMPKVPKEAGAKQLKELIYAEFQRAGVPMKNCVGFASDNASVMTGSRSGLATLIRQDFPWLVNFGCICHSFALCAAAACEAALPRDVVCLANDVYNFIAGSQRRLTEFEESQAFVRAEQHKILYLCRTRWLIMEKVVKRLMEQWAALENYFDGFLADVKAVEARGISKALKNGDLKLYYCFLGYVLPIVNNMNVEFQSEEIRIHAYLKTVETGLRQIMSNFIKKSYLRGKSAFDVDESDPAALLPIETVHFGAKFDALVISKGSSLRALDHVKQRCLSFYQVLCRQIKSRIDHTDPFIVGLRCVDPSVALSGEISSIIPMYQQFEKAFPVDIEKLNSEWRRLSDEDSLLEDFLRSEISQSRSSSCKKKKPKDSTSTAQTSLEKHQPDLDNSSESEDQDSEFGDESDQEERALLEEDPRPDCFQKKNQIDPASFWMYVKSLRDGTDRPVFSRICKFMETLMSLPHSSASAERAFSRLKLFKTPLRNKLSPSTLSSMFHTKRFVPKVAEWTIPSSLIQQARKWKSRSTPNLSRNAP